MFSSLHDALKKLRESKQDTQPPPAKKPAVPGNDDSVLPGQQQRAAAASKTDDGDPIDVGFDLSGLDDADMFDDLLADDLDAIIQQGQQSESPPNPPLQGSTGIARPPGSSTIATPAKQQSAATDRIGTDGAREAGQVGGGGRQHTVFSQTSNSRQQQLPPQHLSPAGPQSQHTQPDPFATPRPAESRSISRLNDQVKTITTTVVGGRVGSQRVPALVRKRQEIPGPAGLIGEPQISGGGVAGTQKPMSPFKTPLSRRVRSEQSSDVDFEGGTWAAMLDHLKMPTYKPSTAKQVTRTIGHAKWPIRRVLESVRTQKIKTMLVQLREVFSSDVDSSALVVDPTGEMRASIHKVVMRRFAHFLCVGCSVILKDVVAMKMPGAQPFLVITAESIDQIFTAKGAGSHDDPIILSPSQATPAVPETPSHAPRRPAADMMQHARGSEQRMPSFGLDELIAVESSLPAASDSDDNGAASQEDERLVQLDVAVDSTPEPNARNPDADDVDDILGELGDDDAGSFLDILDPAD
ncbi:hypothetical protein GQ54DRAFT_203282 [Martensiomyces pterosporus]|nr:hypothetical protein GQ54DRAFT_203282 [Martensiomyces pterosporus]